MESIRGLDPSALRILYVCKEVISCQFLQLCEHIGVETTAGYTNYASTGTWMKSNKKDAKIVAMATELYK